MTEALMPKNTRLISCEMADRKDALVGSKQELSKLLNLLSVVKTGQGRRWFAGGGRATAAGWRGRRRVVSQDSLLRDAHVAVAAVRAAGSIGRKDGLPDGGRVVTLDEGEAGIGGVSRDLEVAKTDRTMDGGAGVAELDRMVLRELFVGEKHRGVLSSGRHGSTINI
jgi:hypothetical protein